MTKFLRSLKRIQVAFQKWLIKHHFFRKSNTFFWLEKNFYFCVLDNFEGRKEKNLFQKFYEERKTIKNKC